MEGAHGQGDGRGAPGHVPYLPTRLAAVPERGGPLQAATVRDVPTRTLLSARANSAISLHEFRYLPTRTPLSPYVNSASCLRNPR
eukprot:2763344-Rhodomonas_salina.1